MHQKHFEGHKACIRKFNVIKSTNQFSTIWNYDKCLFSEKAGDECNRGIPLVNTAAGAYPDLKHQLISSNTEAGLKQNCEFFFGDRLRPSFV